MTGFERVRAFMVHVFTACGAGLALLALILATGGHWTGMFFCLGLALVVDGADGPIARAFDVQKVLPRWSGDTLDLVVDFVTYVFVPAYAIAASGLLPQVLAIPAGILVVISGALYFADREMKTKDNYFRGFPAVWNLAAFYLYLLEPPEWAAAVSIAILAGLSFAPIAVWAALAFIAIVQVLSPGLYVVLPLSLIAVYFFTIGLLRRPA
jgi:phosphatidylcholine synthase